MFKSFGSRVLSSFDWRIRRARRVLMERWIRLTRTTRSGLFAKYYESGFWRNAESASGCGSDAEFVRNMTPQLRGLLVDRKVNVLLDAPCGDLNWMEGVLSDCPNIRYIGMDIVPSLINELSMRRILNAEFICADLCVDPLPPADLWLCRDLLFHLSFRDIASVLANLLRSDIHEILVTSHDVNEENLDIRTGGYRKLNLQIEPFSFPIEAEACIDDSGNLPTRRMLMLWKKDQLVNSIESFVQKFGCPEA